MKFLLRYGLLLSVFVLAAFGRLGATNPVSSGDLGEKPSAKVQSLHSDEPSFQLRDISFSTLNHRSTDFDRLVEETTEEEETDDDESRFFYRKIVHQYALTASHPTYTLFDSYHCTREIPFLNYVAINYLRRYILIEVFRL